MKFQKYDNVNSFIDEVMDIVAENEIQNNLIISNSLRGKEKEDTSGWLMASVKDDAGAVKLVAMMTPPHNLCMYETGNIPDDNALNLLIKEVAAMKTEISGVLTEKVLAAKFVKGYGAASGKAALLNKKMRIFRLDRVNDISVSLGRIRQANEKDLYFLPYWKIAFDSDCRLPGSDILKTAEQLKTRVNAGNMYIWEDEIPVSKAAMGRKTLNGAIVNAVYTPPYYRGKGYATSCVAGLSRILLESSYKFCSLFTDLANPISNSIYMKIGYVPVCDYDEYKFV